MWLSKLILLSLCLPLIILTIFTNGGAVKAEEQTTDGFVIEADRVVGSGMTANIIKQDTSTNSGKLMLRFHYKSAIIYGMKLTKQVNSPKGPVSISLKANGPVSVRNMTVDTSAIVFKGACVKASETVPELGMEQVVMVAHFMESENIIIKQLVLNTVSGQSSAPKPGRLKIIQDLSSLPLHQLDKELDKISSGHMPLTCEEGSKIVESSDAIGKITEPVEDVIEVMTNPLKTVPKPLEPIVDPFKPIVKPLELVTEPLEPVLKPLESVTKKLETVLNPLEPVTKSLDPIVSGTTEKVEQIVKSVCEQMEDAKGVINKELALSLIDEAIEKKILLSSVCRGDTSLTKKLQSWEEGLLKSLGLIDLIGKVVPEDPIEQLNKMREKVAKEKEGAIIFSP
ncbi:hypothetical protein J7E79_07605 [Bacillus sp. ISL-40]|uniref:exocyst complex component Sec6 family protein n=1 Tax=unclassified Bacillus (in: firmicutes) TaxID=185979 RepID=UPI001BEC4080|nr:MULTISPECIES: exocyst complex component Sec6 family protein [unclassified Bacillus (in: firmicutes)]MBT2697276.1 hypothetical protein [Bacillus sp. ISL-40]MBT2724043.1 hypothetical protein [Bacillus sp. ISL-46]MBT2741907.1 hypothetical protein [Bacillus sp. ISL-77]